MSAPKGSSNARRGRQNRTGRFNIRLEPSMLVKLDKAAKSAGVSRNEYIINMLDQCL